MQKFIVCVCEICIFSGAGHQSIALIYSPVWSAPFDYILPLPTFTYILFLLQEAPATGGHQVLPNQL